MTVRHVTANIKLASPDWEMGFQVNVPESPIAIRELLPLAQNLANAIVDATVREIETRGEKISCCKAANACRPALAKLGTPKDNPPEAHWVPLVLALEWVATIPDAPPSRSGPDLLGELMRHLTGKEPMEGSEQTPDFTPPSKRFPKNGLRGGPGTMAP
jgi:hypothetical protein